MNNRYICRGKRQDNGAWETGFLVIKRWDCSDERYFITDKMTGWHTPVIPETVGQCTGLQDKNGEPIFEGDIVDVMHDPHYIGIAIQRIGVFKVMFHEGCFMKRNEKGFFHFIPSDECKIVGNVFDNPDLTEVEK